MSLLSRFALLFALLTPVAHAAAAPAVAADWPYVETRLKKAGLTPEFIASLHAHYEADHFLQVLELNTLLFLKKSDYHGPQINDDAVTTVRDFMTAHRETLVNCRKKYGVPSEVVASLLWIESRHGKAEGQFHVPSVFVDLVQATRPEVVRHLNEAALKFTAKVTKAVKRDIASRTKKRVAWAIAELKALEKMHQRDAKLVEDLRGSFAGAFGMPQFIPSSYNAYAQSAEPADAAEETDDGAARVPDLERADDAIFSVAFYLHKSGWHRGRKKSFVKALMMYNNSHDYANAILKLAQLALPTPGKAARLPAGRDAN